MGSLMSSARASSIFLPSLNFCHNHNALLSPANCYGVSTSQLLITQNGRAPAIQWLVAQNLRNPNNPTAGDPKKIAPSQLVVSKMLAQKSEEEKGGILKYLPPLYLPMLPFFLTTTVHPTVFLLAVTKIRCNRRYNGFYLRSVGLNGRTRYLAQSFNGPFLIKFTGPF